MRLWLGLLLGKRVPLCTAVGRAEGVPTSKAITDADYRVQTQFMKAQELKKRHFHGWTHTVLLDRQVLSVWTPLWRFINHCKCLSEVKEQTPIQLSEPWILILKYLIRNNTKKDLEPEIDPVIAEMRDRERARLINSSYACFTVSKSSNIFVLHGSFYERKDENQKSLIL